MPVLSEEKLSTNAAPMSDGWVDGDKTSKVTSATFTFVAIDLEGRPRPLPPETP